MKSKVNHNPEPERVPLSFRVPAEDRERLEEMAERMGAPVSSAARLVLKRGLAQPPEILI